MKAIDVLRHHSGYFSRLFQPGNRLMSGVWLRIAKERPALQLVIPMFDAGRVGSHEIVVVHRLTPFPNPVWTAKIGYPAARGNSRAGEYQNIPGLL